VDAVNATLIEVFRRDQNQWLLAHILHLFAPGIPQVYYNDLLGQRNDEERWHETGEGRELMRHNHPAHLLEHKFKQPFVQRVLRVMELRNTYPAFQGTWKIIESPQDEFCVKWVYKEYSIILHMNLTTHLVDVQYYDVEQKRFELLDLT
jgi:sucrose phosphorylase